MSPEFIFWLGVMTLVLAIITPASFVGISRRYGGDLGGLIASAISITGIIIGLPAYWVYLWKTECDVPPVFVGNEAIDNDGSCRSLIFGIPIFALSGLIALALVFFVVADRSSRKKARKTTV